MPLTERYSDKSPAELKRFFSNPPHAKADPWRDLPRNWRWVPPPPSPFYPDDFISDDEYAESFADHVPSLPKGQACTIIKRVVAHHYDVRLSDITSARRNANIVWARHVGMYLAHDLTNLSTPVIGRQFGGKDHTTVLHAVRKLSGMIEADPLVAHEIGMVADKIRRELSTRG